MPTKLTQSSAVQMAERARDIQEEFGKWLAGRPANATHQVLFADEMAPDDLRHKGLNNHEIIEILHGDHDHGPTSYKSRFR